MSLKQNKILILNKDFSINNIIIRALDNHNCVLIENEQEFIDKLRSDFDIILISDSYATNQYRLIEKVLLTFKGLFIVITNNKDSFNSNNIKKISSPLNILELKKIINDYEKTLAIKEENYILNIIKKHVEDNSKKLITLFEPHTRISGLIYLDSGDIVHAEYKDLIGNKAITNLLRMNNPLLSIFNNISIPVITCNYGLKEKQNFVVKEEKQYKAKILLINKNLKLNNLLSKSLKDNNLETINLDDENKIEKIENKELIHFILIDDSFVTDLQKIINKIIINFKNTYLIILSKNQQPFESNKNTLFLLKPFNLLELEQIIEFNLLNKPNKESLLKYIDNIISDKKIITIKSNDSNGLIYIKNNKIIHAEYDSLIGLEALKYILNLSNINFSSLPWNDPILSTLNITFKNEINIPEVPKIPNNVVEKKEDNKLKILIVDDDTTSTKILSKFLSGQNYFTKTANSAIEGEKILLEENFDLVITDINMPEVNGLEFLLWIKQYFPEIKVVIITAFHNENIKNFSNQRGAFYYFEKPVDLNEMVKLLKEAFADPTQYSDLKMNDYVKVSIVSKLNKVIEIIDIYTQNKSYIYIKDGKIIHAESGKLTGIDALHEIFKSESGIFSDIPWREPNENTLSYNDLLLFINSDQNNKTSEQKQTVTQRLHSIVDQIRSETEIFNKYTIYEEGVALEIILGKTTKNEALKIMENYSSEKFKFDEVSQILIYQDLSLTILFSDNGLVSEMRFGRIYKGATSKGIKIGDPLRKGIDIYGKPDVFTLKGAIWKNIALFSSDGITITSIRIRSN